MADLQLIGEVGVVPVVKIEDSGNAFDLGRALMEGDLPIAEITFRTEAAEEAIRILSQRIPEMLVGAGTVLTTDQVARAADAGAQFVVSPGFNAKVVDRCLEKKIPVFPGVNNPTGIEMALERDLKLLKFFPAEASGGLAMLKAMAGPYDSVSFIPTGGINPSNLMSYLRDSRVYACGGSWMVKADLIAAGRYDEITRMAKEAVNLVLGFGFAHLGINEKNEKNARRAVQRMEEIFSFSMREQTRSVYAGENVEVMKEPNLGERGHIAIATNDLQRAIGYLKRKGVAVKQDTALNRGGKTVLIYTDEEIAGFALHLVQR